jgi:hypothetical protein
MGVIFWAGRRMRKLDEAELKEFSDREEYVGEDLFLVRGNPQVPQIAEGLEVGATYQCAEITFFSFYNWRYCRDWTGKLWDMVGCTEEEVLAADSTAAFRDYFLWAQKGTLGPVASAKLAAQFAAWDERAKAFADEDFYETYALMRLMFEWTAQDGLLFLRSA